ncbi:hypothetical protein ACQ4M3_13315 [Leptolyngbya sp. AN03gr2]|uniref:hypothetical protein n=1 Tax=unclassified Leptolyngbya TaxID=2650499 RepID=UPI003D3140AB
MPRLWLQPDEYEQPMEAFANLNYHLEFRRYPSGNTCVLILDRLKTNEITTLTVDLDRVSLYPNECLCPLEEDSRSSQYLQELIAAQILTPKADTVCVGNQSARVYTIHGSVPTQTIVRVFHNRNGHFRETGDPDYNANLYLAATVFVPDSKDPLSYAFEVTNSPHRFNSSDQINLSWSDHPNVRAESFDPKVLPAELRLAGICEHRSTSVGDVLEVIPASTQARRYLVKDIGFSLI